MPSRTGRVRGENKGHINQSIERKKSPKDRKGRGGKRVGMIRSLVREVGKCRSFWLWVVVLRDG